MRIRKAVTAKIMTVGTCLALLPLMAACSSGSTGSNGFAQTQSKGNARSVVLLNEPWDDLEAENVIAQQLLSKLGYSASIDDLAVDVGAKSMEDGQVDAFLGNWWPSQEPTFGTMISQGKVKVLGTLLTGTQYAPAIPGATAQKYHISSLADLAKHGAAFGYKIYGIEPGTPGNATLLKMISNNDYGLGKWQVVQSSTPAMLAQVERAVSQHQAIVFLGWSPHWMVPQFHTVFLADPLHAWGGAGEIRTMVSASFASQSPQITRFLTNLKFTTDQAGEFYLEHDKQGMSYAAIASAWIKANPGQVRQFLAGVLAADGKPAQTVVSGLWTRGRPALRSPRT
jgi:glycine betaine/proline transport system substrate-binding protein